MNKEGNKNVLLNKLDEFIRKYYKNLLVRGFIYTTGLLLISFLLFSTIEYFAEFESLVRMILFYAFVCASLFILIAYIFIPILKLNKLGKLISYEEAANIIGKHFTNVQDKLINVLQLQQNKADAPSFELLEAGISQKINELKPIPFSAAIDLSENRKYLKFALVPLLLMISVWLIAPKVLQTGSSRILHYDQIYEKALPFQFELLNKDLTVLQQSDYELQVKVNGNEVPNEVFVRLGNAEYKLDKKNNTNFSYLLKNVQSDLSFVITGAGYNSGEYRLKVLPKPSLLNFSLNIKFPSYLNRKDEMINNTGDLILPQGSKLSWHFNTRNTDYIDLRLFDSVIRLNGDNGQFNFSRKLMQSIVYSLKAGNNLVSPNDSVSYSIQVIPDMYPSIDLNEKRDSLKNNLVYFSGMVKDDYGFNKLNFHFKISSKDSSEKTIETEKEISIPLQKNANSQPYIFFMDMQTLNLNPGDKVEYYFQVWDNDGINGSKSAKTNSLLYKAPTIEELEKIASQKNSEIKKDMDESIKKAKEIQKDINQLNKNILEKKQLGWEEKKKMENLLEKQKELEKKLENIKQENQINTEQQNQFNKTDENILEKQKQLEQLFENIMAPDMKKLFDELQKLMEKMDKNKVQETLEKMDLNNKDIEKELDRTLEQFKQMEVEQKMENAINKLDELSKKQEKLSEEALNKNSDNKALEQKQNELNKEFEQFKEDIKAMEELNKKLENPIAMPDTKEQQQKTSEDMKNAGDQLQKNNKKNASKSQKQAAEQMKAMSEMMNASMQQSEQNQNEEDMQSLRQIMENLMNVSFEQEELVQQTPKTKTNNPQYIKLAQRQKKLQDDSEIIEDSLLALSKRNPKVSAIINREITAIQHNMKKSIESLAERQSGEATIRQQNAMTSVNNLALLLNEALEQMQAEAKQQQKNKSSGSGSCKKPGSKGNKPSMANMRQMQEQLNKQIEQMKKMMEQGKNPNGKKPNGQQGKQGMNGSMPGMSEQLAKMAAEQEAIRRAMQEALQKMQKEGGKNPGGNLAEKMEETETELVNKLITQETIKRQQEILTKLLEHEKAEREKDMDEKRKSNEAKNETYSNQNLFLEYKRLKEQEIELLKTVPPSLSPYYKAKVSSYFNNFAK